MKTSDPKQQFLTSLKNGKIGVFRPQLSLSELKVLLKDQIKITDTDEESIWLGKYIEVYFENNFMTRVRFKLHKHEKPSSWLKLIELSWITYIFGLTFIEIKKILEEDGIKFRTIEYNYGEFVILLSSSHIQWIMFFYADGKLDQAHLEFDFRFRLFNDIKEITDYPR